MVEVLHVDFDLSYERCSKFRNFLAEGDLLPSFSNLERLRLVSFAPYISGPAFVEFLHPDARPELVSSLSLENGPLRLDGPSFQNLNELRLDLDGDQRKRNAKIPRTKLYLPSSLSRLKLFSIDRGGIFLSLDAAVPALTAIEIVERGLEAQWISSFFRLQGPFVTSLVLLGKDLDLAAS